jgi:hypothetical protein
LGAPKSAFDKNVVDCRLQNLVKNGKTIVGTALITLSICLSEIILTGRFKVNSLDKILTLQNARSLKEKGTP